MNRAPQEIKIKINKSRQLKIYQENSTERNFNREFCAKETQIQRNLKHFDKTKKKKKPQKRKEKYSYSKNVVSRTLSQINFPHFVLKKLQHFIFFIPFFLTSLYKISFSKTLLSVLSFWTNIRTRKLRNLRFKFCDGKLTKIPKRDFIFARVKTGQVGTWSPTEISPVQSSSLSYIRTGILHEGII